MLHQFEIMATGSDKNLDKKVTNHDVDKLATFIVKWEKLRGYLGLDYAKQKEIENAGDYGKQKMECVEEWRQKAGEKATYREFIKAAREAGLNDLADKVEAMLREPETPAECKLILKSCLCTCTCNNSTRRG